METLQIHSKAFLIKWISVPEGGVISWQVKPIKKSINVGIYRFRGKPSAIKEQDQEQEFESVDSKRQTLLERLQKNGFVQVKNLGKCTADQPYHGDYTIVPEHAGMYAMIFDNTFSKAVAKTVLYGQFIKKPGTSESTVQSTLVDVAADAEGPEPCEDVPHEPPRLLDVPKTPNSRCGSIKSVDQHKFRRGSAILQNSRHVCGFLLKKRRKKLQGFARRYFSLDRKYALLNYFLEPKSSSLRGSMPLKLCVVTYSPSSLEIIIDSGMEVWRLKAQGLEEFSFWETNIKSVQDSSWPESSYANQLSGSQESVLETSYQSVGPLGHSGASRTHEQNVHSANKEKYAFKHQDWTSLQTTVAALEETSVILQSSLVLLSSNNTQHSSAARPPSTQLRSSYFPQEPMFSYTSPSSPEESGSQVRAVLEKNLQDCSVQLENHILAFRKTFARVEPMSLQPVASATTEPEGRLSEEIFFDADDQADWSGEEEEEDDDDDDDDEDPLHGYPIHAERPQRSQGTLYPLEHVKPVNRRTTIAKATSSPPKYINLLSKNVGKDLTALTMPVTANEPLSILQRVSEMMEHSSLLDKALRNYPEGSAERILYVALFAMSSLSSFRDKERSLRKPYNSLLGETFEFVSPEQGFRLVAEKIQHKPLVLALEAESADWVLNFTSKPIQKFWGKSMEFGDQGVVRIKINSSGEVYEYLPAVTFLRNMIAGEKYIEPVGTMSILSSKGEKAVVEFKAGGMFSGRSEELKIKATDALGQAYDASFEGKWTGQVFRVDKKSSEREPVWTAGTLVPDSGATFGFTRYAARLNEITEIEFGRMAPSDSRLRPDQRYYEEGNVQKAEELKLHLEQLQRDRRKDMELEGVEWKPSFFELNPDGVFYQCKGGKANYWYQRQRATWTVPNLFDTT